MWHIDPIFHMYYFYVSELYSAVIDHIHYGKSAIIVKTNIIFILFHTIMTFLQFMCAK